MSNTATVLAFDFGASSGRAIRAVYDGQNLTYEEIHRFENVPIEKDGHLCWDVETLLKEIHTAIQTLFCGNFCLRSDGQHTHKEPRRRWL